MKRLGYLENGRILLECNEAEYKALHLLSEVADGKTIWGSSYEYANTGIDADLQSAFEAIKQWIEVKDRANQLRSIANRIDDVIGVTPNE